MFLTYRKTVCLCGALLALTAAFASANAGTISEPVAKIHGTIFQESAVVPDSHPIPAPGASVRLIDTDTQRLVGETKTDQRGRFSLPVYKAGKYVLKATKRGSGSASLAFKVSEGDTIETSLVLKK